MSALRSGRNLHASTFIEALMHACMHHSSLNAAVLRSSGAESSADPTFDEQAGFAVDP